MLLKFTVAGTPQVVLLVLVKLDFTPPEILIRLGLFKILVHPALFFTCRVTPKFPATTYVCNGLCKEDKVPSPKSQVHCTIVPELAVDKSVNCTFRG